MDERTYKTYRRVCDASYHQAELVTQEARGRVEDAELHLERLHQTMVELDQRASRLASEGVSAAQLLLIENRRRMLLDELARIEQQVDARRLSLRNAEDERDTAAATQRTCERVGEKLARDDRRLAADREQLELDDIGNARAGRRS